MDTGRPGRSDLRAAGGLRSDVVAGVVLAAILVPQGMAYAELAGLPPVTGLYTSIGCLVGYAVFGPSRILVLGPDSSISPMIFAALMPLLVGGDTHRAIALAGMLAVIVALIEIGLGIGRPRVRRRSALERGAGRLHERSRPHHHRRPAAQALRVLDRRRGLRSRAQGLLRAPDSTPSERRSPSAWGCWPSSWCSLDSPGSFPPSSSAIVVATVVSAIFDLHAHGVSTVGTLPRGIPRPSLPWTKFADVGPLMVAAVGITLVSLADTIATSSSFGARRGEEVDPNQEMIGIGAANLAAGLLQGFAVSTSGSRTAVVEQAGAKSQLASVVGAGIVAVLLLFFNSLLADLPQSALAAVLIAAALLPARPRRARSATTGSGRARWSSRSSPAWA